MNETTDSSPPATGSGTCERTILIVDDTPTSAAALELACAAIEGVTVSAVSSALDAVRMLKERGACICAVITDIRMPVMDGFELIQFIRRDSRHGGTPIIVVTADTDPDTLERSSRLGASACFLKPFSPAAIRKALERFLYGNKQPD